MIIFYAKYTVSFYVFSDWFIRKNYSRNRRSNSPIASSSISASKRKMLSILILRVLFYNWHLNDYLYTIIYTRCLPVNSQPFLRSNHYQLYGVTRRRRTRLSSTSINSRFPIKPLLHDTILIAPSTFLLFSYYYYGDLLSQIEKVYPIFYQASRTFIRSLHEEEEVEDLYRLLWKRF